MLPAATVMILAAFLMPVPICWPALNARLPVAVRCASNLPRDLSAALSGPENWSFSPSEAMSLAVSAAAMTAS